MATLLLELFSEEIPSRMQRGAAEQLERLTRSALEKNLLTPTACKTFVSPRHLAIQCFGLAEIQPDMREERKGPKVGSPEQAIKGFLTASGVTLAQCEQRVVGKDSYYFATIERKGRATAEVVKELFESILREFSWPKSMRWGARPLSWVRPLHRITCLLDSTVIPLQFAHLTAANVTEGHRFLAPSPLTIPHAEEYEPLLQTAFVKIDPVARCAKIAGGIATLAAENGLTVVADEALLDEVTGLVEWPVPLLGSFDAKFLDLPSEVLISEMKVHQRYFALQDASGKLTNQFIAVANMVTEDGGKAVIAGNARVLRARLSDGEFYWEQDKKTSLETWGKKLSDVVFHAKVGMMNEKVERIEALAIAIASALRSPLAGEPKSALRDSVGGIPNDEAIHRAAQLCKADLTSGMVGEFPELQGIMGRYYALAQGEDGAIADAIRDHYKPLGANDTVPESPLAAIIALADKIDSIRALFKAGEKPTGSKDPLALRRAALGILRIILHYEWPLALDYWTDQETLDFYGERLKVILREKGLRHDVIDAALATERGGFNPLAVSKRAENLQAFVSCQPETLVAIKRSCNILAAEEKKDKTQFAPKLQKTYPTKEEHALAASLAAEFPTPDALTQLTAPINRFFDEVLVNEPEFRESRLSLLASVRAKALEIADFSKLEG